MLRYKVTFCFVVLLMATGASYGQVDASLDALRNVIPPSPNVSALGKFGDWPVGLFTGVPSIDIPIYQLKGRSVSVPVSIDYHAAGIRVGETASWVGLGWALNAGGCISRTIQGLPDEDGYLGMASNYPNPNNFCNGAINSTVLATNELNAVAGEFDTQQDIYNLNALGKSYRLYINAANDSAYTMPASNIRITRNFLQNTNADSSTWAVILEDGTQLFFGGANPGNYLEQTSNSTMGIGNFVSAWYLQSIQSVTGEVITFTYTPSTIVQPVHLTQSDYIEYLTGGNASGVATFLGSPATSTLGSHNTITQLSLTTIESDLTRVYFIPSTTARTDLSGGYALSEIKVLSKLTNAYIEDWIFNDYYAQAPSGRLHLGGLTRNSMDGTPPQVWTFGYNPLSLPSPTSFAQDYWGFYNGATSNVSLLPPMPFNGADCTIWPSAYTGTFPDNLTVTNFLNEGFMPSTHDIGNVRSASETYMQAEILNQITYPTGGYSVFNYEANKQQGSQQVFTKANPNPLVLYLVDTTTVYSATQSYQFTTTVPQYVNVSLSSYIGPGVSNDLANPKVAVSLVGTTNGLSFTNQSGDVSQYINLWIPGTYNLEISTNIAPDDVPTGTDVYATASISYLASQGTQTVTQYFGGLRINNIQDFDGISPTPVKSKYYTYANPFVINPVDTVNDFLTIQNFEANNSEDEVSTTYTKVTRNASTKYALGTIQGGTVGYGQVTTLDGLNGANGYTVSTFRTDAASQADAASLNFPYPPTDPHSWRSGLLLSEQTYTASGVPVKSTANSYNFVNPFMITNVKYGTSTAYSGSSTTQTQVLSGITTMCFSLTNEQVEKTSSTETTYDASTGDALSTTTSYYYDDPWNMQPVRTVSFNSKGDSVVTYSRTPLEVSAINASIPLTASATAALDTMISRNMVSQPVESERYVGGTSAGSLGYKSLTNYAVQPTGLVLPNNLMLQNAANPIETRVNYLAYDNYGNLLEQAKSNDENHSYIYDYLSSYPIAEVVNADPSSIAYSSFESNGTGGWTPGTGGTFDASKGFTGSNSYIPSGGITSPVLNSGVTYVISYWTTGTTPITLTGTLSGYPIQGKSITLNGYTWTYYEYEVTGVTSVSLSGSANIDELRLYPATAQLTTYTYSPLVGMTSRCDADNKVTYYEYDGMNRLKDIKDQDGNVIKTYQYQYQGQ